MEPKIVRKITQQDLSWLINLYQQGRLILEPDSDESDHPYQKSDSWPEDRQYSFLDTIMKNYPSPPIYLQKQNGDDFMPIYRVIDGKQRIKTLIDYHNDKLITTSNPTPNMSDGYIEAQYGSQKRVFF